MVGAFGKDLVLTGKVDRSLSNTLGKVLNMRLIADYNGDPVASADAEWAAEETERFVAAIERALPGLAFDEPSDP